MITELTNRSISVQVPDDKKLHSFSLVTIQGLSWLHFLDKDKNDICRCVQLPAGTWSILDRTNDLSEEQWRGIVNDPIWIGGFGNMYSNYVDDVTYAKEIWKRTGPFKTATESGQSLLKSKNVFPSDVIILIKQ